MPVRALNSSALRCWVLPTAIVPMVSLPGWLRAWASRSFSVPRREFAGTASPSSKKPSVVIGSS